MTKERLNEYVRELVEEAAGNGNPEVWLKPRERALLEAIDRLPDEPGAPPVRALIEHIEKAGHVYSYEPIFERVRDALRQQADPPGVTREEISCPRCDAIAPPSCTLCRGSGVVTVLAQPPPMIVGGRYCYVHGEIKYGAKECPHCSVNQ